MRIAPRGTWKVKAGPRKIAVALTGLLLSFAVLAGLAQAGGRYFYCPEMRLVQTDPCSAASHKDERAGSGSTLCPRCLDCCELWTLPSVPPGTIAAEARAVAPPPLLAVVSPLQLLLGRSTSDRRGLARVSERWRAPPRPPGERRARLMVFLT